MTAATTFDPRHLVSREVAALRGRLTTLAQTPVWSMTPAESAATLVETGRLGAQLAELELRLAEHAREVHVEDTNGATSLATWWAHATRQTRLEAHRKTRLATALTRYHLLHTALATGEVLPEQAHAIAHALDRLPDDLDPEILLAAEARLVDLAHDHDAKDLRALGRRILDVIDPTVGEAQEAKQLDDEERQARTRARLTLADDGHGQVRGRFTLPTAQGAMLKKMLLALTAPTHHATTPTPGTGPDAEAGAGRRPGPERLGQALIELIERYPTDRLPTTGGLAATVVVTMDLATLLGAQRAATLDTGEKITADQARRMACEAGIIPAVLGGDSQVLDLGRTRRFHNKAQRIVLGLQQRGCTAEGCDWPPGLCHAHHDLPWHLGGHTTLKGGRLLCPRHHTRAHDPRYTTTHLPGGKVAFTRRP